jgi:hypothetical protein
MHPTIEFHQCLLCMERRPLQNTAIHTLSSIKRRVVPHKYIRQMPRASSTPYPHITVKSRNLHLPMDKKMESERNRCQPPNKDTTPANIEYLAQYNLDSAYINSQSTNESLHAYKKRIYNTILYYIQRHPDAPTKRIERLWPLNDRDTTWKNLHDTHIPSCQTAICYKTVHDILRTNVRLHKINMSSTDKCRYCDTQDTILHRLIKCGATQLMWKWTANKIATIVRTVVRYIPPE